MKFIYYSIFLLVSFHLQGQSDHLVKGWPIKSIQTTENGEMTLGSSETKGKGPLSFLLISEGTSATKGWQRTYGGISYDRASDIVMVEDGYLLLGSTSSYGNGNYDALLIKIDQKGKEIWRKTYGDFFNEYAEHFVKAEDDNYIFKMRKQYCDDNNMQDCTYGDWYIKVDKDGNRIREKNSIFGM